VWILKKNELAVTVHCTAMRAVDGVQRCNRDRDHRVILIVIVIIEIVIIV
jgi:hypothetical protein